VADKVLDINLYVTIPTIILLFALVFFVCFCCICLCGTSPPAENVTLNPVIVCNEKQSAVVQKSQSNALHSNTIGSRAPNQSRLNTLKNCLRTSFRSSSDTRFQKNHVFEAEIPKSSSKVDSITDYGREMKRFRDRESRERIRTLAENKNETKEETILNQRINSSPIQMRKEILYRNYANKGNTQSDQKMSDLGRVDSKVFETNQNIVKLNESSEKSTEEKAGHQPKSDKKKLLRPQYYRLTKDLSFS